MSLLDDAKRQPIKMPGVRLEYTHSEIELAIAYLSGEVRQCQVFRAIQDLSNPSNVGHWAARALIYGLQHNMVKLQLLQPRG